MNRYFRLFALVGCIFGMVATSWSYERIVLIEEFTSATCPPCVQGSENMNRVVNPAEGIISIRYHMDWPAPNDPFNVHNYAENMARRNYYGVSGIPHAHVCGEMPGVNPVNLEQLQQAVMTWKQRSTPLDITVVEDRTDPQNVQVLVSVTSTEALQNLTLRVAVVARFVELPDLPQTLPNSNGETEFYDAMLDMLPDANGTTFSIDQGETKNFTFTYAMGSGELWPDGQIYVTAFVQDDQTKEVLQAGTNLVELGVELQATAQYLRVDPQSSVTTTIAVTNPYAEQDLRVIFSIDEAQSLIPMGWQSSLSVDTLNLAAGEKKTVTLTISAPASAGYAKIVLKARTLVTDAIGRIDRIAVGCLSNATRYIAYPVLGWGLNAVQGITALPDYGEYTTLMPELTPDLLAAYPLEDFDAVLIFTDFWTRGLLSANVLDVIGQPLRNGIRAAMHEGKGVWISAPLDPYFARHPQYGSADAQDFWRETVGIQSQGSPIARVQLDNNGRITGVLPFSVEGVSGDSVGDGIQLNFNTMSNWQQVPIVIYTENITVVGNDVVEALYDNEGRVAGIRREDSQTGGRLVYLTFPLHGTTDVANLAQLMHKIMVWITGGSTAPKPPTVAAPAEVNFGEVEIGQTKTKTIDIANAGDEPLEITALDLYDDSQVFSVQGIPALPVTLDPGQKIQLEVTFTPAASEEYIAMFLITSNDPKNSVYSVVLTGRGVGISSVVLPSIADPNLRLRSVSDDQLLMVWEGKTAVMLKIRDLQGRVLQTVHLLPHRPWLWNARSVAAGTYLITVDAGERTHTIPVVVAH